MELDYNKTILNEHLQKTPDSCVPMSVELLLKLSGHVKSNYYDIQDGRRPEGFKINHGCGKEYHEKTIEGVTLYNLFTENRHTYDLAPLFDKIKLELDEGRFVQIALESGRRYDAFGKLIIDYHCWIVYGYTDDGEFLAVTKYHNDAFPLIPLPPVTISDVKTQITKIGGTDILTY